MADPVRKSFVSGVNARIWRTVVAAGAMIGAPAICAPEAAYADVDASRGVAMSPTAAAGQAASRPVRVAQAKPGSGSAPGAGSASGSGSGSAPGSGSGSGSGSGTLIGTGPTKVTGPAPGTQPTKRPRTRKRRKNVGRGFVLS